MADINENEKPDQPGQNEENGETASGMFRRRRRDMASASESSPKQEPKPTPAATPVDETVSAESAAEAKSPPPIQETVEAAKAPVAKSEAKKKNEPEKKEEGKGEDEVTPGRRAMRCLLILAVFGVAWLGLVMNLKKMQDANKASTRAQLLRLPTKADKVDHSKGNKEAEQLANDIKSGKHADVVAVADKMRKKYPGNRKIQQVTFKAECIEASIRAGKKLDSLPLPDPSTDTQAPVQEMIEQLTTRMAQLDILRGQREDWGEEFTRLPEVEEIYERYNKEMASVKQTLSDWKAALASLKRAREQIEATPPGYTRGAELLRAAWGFLPLGIYPTIASNAEAIGEAEYLLHRNIVDRTVKSLKKADLSDVKIPRDSSEIKSNIKAIQIALKKQYIQIESKVGEWDRINTALENAKLAYDKGTPDKALSLLTQARKASNPAAPLTRSILRRLDKRIKHYRDIKNGWDLAIKTKKEKGLGDQLAAWSSFQKVLEKEDVYYDTAFINELRQIKAKIKNLVATHYASLIKASSGYRRITLNMRKPENPRGPFAEQAAILHKMAVQAEKIRDTADLVPNWNLGDDTDQQVSYAKSILGDHNDQARRLHNLYILYQKRGKLQLARECLIRVRILGKVSSNPWYSEAVQLLTGQKPETSSTPK